MSEDTMPAAEANEGALENETYAYELAFHVLPTVAEGEVSSVFEQIKTLITKDGGSLFDEEAPERFELAYEIVKHLEGKNRKFTSAYFGWVRFKGASSIIEPLLEEIAGRTDILRHLLIKLTRVEEENPFRFHPALAHEKKVTTIDEAELVTEAKEVAEVPAVAEVAVETEGAVDLAEVEKALKEDEA